MANTRPIVFMDVNIGETPAGRLKMELFSDIVPKCVQSVRCTIHVLRFQQDGRELQAAMYWRVQVRFIMLNKFSARNLVDIG